MKKQTASTKSVQKFREKVVASLGAGGAVLLNVIDALAIGPRHASPVELTLTEVFAYEWSSLYQALRRAEDQLAETIEKEDWLRDLCAGRLNWLGAHPPEKRRVELGPWRVRILDASNYHRPKTRTVEVGYVHGAEGMKPGHGLSLLSERVGEGSWMLSLELAWFSPQSDPLSFGAAQLEGFVKQHGWSADQVLAVDAQYTVAPFLKPVRELGVPLLGRVRNNRCLYLPPPRYLVATAFWLLWALRDLAKPHAGKFPGWWRSGKLMPGAVRRMAAGLLMGFGWSKPQPKPRRKSPGRIAGTKLEPRKRFKVYRKAT